MTGAQARWDAAKQRAQQPGSAVLGRWLQGRPGADSRIRDDITVSTGDSRELLLDFFGVNPTAAGMSVTATSAMRVSAVFACVQRIASLATLPAHVYERTDKGRQRVENSPLWWLLNEQPSPGWTAASHWERVVQYTLLRGDAFTEIRRNAADQPKELVPHDWSCVTTTRRDDGTLWYAVRDGARAYGVEQDDMLHFPGFGFDGCKSMSVIAWAARQAVGNAMAMDEYSGRFFSGGAHPSIVLEASGKMDPDKITALQVAFAAKYSGVQNAFQRPLVLTEGITAKEISLSAEDAQLLEGRKFQVIDIARAFGVPPHMIGETSASTSWGSGIEQMGRAFVTYTLQPHLVRIEQELNRKLFPNTVRRFIEFNRDALLEGDSKTQSEVFRGALGGPGTGNGWMTVNEVRRIKNLPPIEGGDVLYTPPAKPGDPPPKEPKA